MAGDKRIDEMIKSYGDWRGDALARLRVLINKADSELVEDWKWNTAVWTKNGLVVAIGGFKDHVKINFFQGARLSDAKGVFNAGLDAKTMRSVDFYEGDTINEADLTELVIAATKLNDK